ncbi:3-hydroxybutyryl-CoA dehydrogenase [Filimonas zeae]|nr:3-hydroxyacyl-CoA dehydrogenase NAD-binding domain-containing protein [Filimonas zeae]MDR6342406.1 3-hydroxybutyryl-CoA dehydrogenase [Filimonas zeae]
MSQSGVICVCGAGTMGSGIAQLAARAGYRTIQFDMQETMLQKSRNAIETALNRLTEKGSLSAAEAASTLDRITFTSNQQHCQADIIIEAIVEELSAKAILFQQLSALNTPTTIFATNTSSISINTLAQHIPHPERLAGMHFFNPAPVMKLVEVVKGRQTNAHVTERLVQLAEEMGKTAVECTDSPGFIVNRVARPYYLEAMRAAERYGAEPADIDALLEATGFKMGPFKLMDLIGMDVNFAVSQLVWEALDKPERLQPSSLQQQKVTAGELGRKTGKGFYQYL